MRVASIRSRLAVRLAVVTFASYIVFSVALYEYFSRILEEDLDTFTASRAVGVSQSIMAWAEAAAFRGGWPGRPAGKNAFKQLAVLWKESSAGTGLFLSAAVQIYASDGSRLAATHGFDAYIGLSTEVLARAKAGKITYQYLKTPVEIGGSREFRVMTKPLGVDTPFDLAVQVIVSTARVDTALAALRLLLILLAPAAALASGAATAFVAGRIVEPIGRMAATLGRITERRLDERVDAPRDSKELGELASAFNAMLERVQRAFGEQARFTNDAAHQLRTPLTVLRGELELALKRVRSSDEYERVLASNLEEVERMNRLVGRMLDLARLDAGTVEFAEDPVRVDLILREIADDLGPLAESEGIAFDLTQIETAKVIGDPSRLRQAFWSLVENALRYSCRDGVVDLASSEDAESVRATVRDRGKGIPPSELESIFLRFHRGSNAVGSGYGIGLSAAHLAVELHGGKLIASNHPDGGALFIATFPKPRNS